MGGAVRAILSPLPVLGAVEIAIWLLGMPVRTKVHSPTTVGTVQKSCEYLCGGIFPLTAAVGDLSLDLLENFL